MADLSNPLTQVVVGQSQPAVTVNNLVDALSPAACFGQNDLTTSGLTWGYYGGRFGGLAIAHGMLALPANESTIYIVANKSTGVLSQSTSITNWDDTATYQRLHIATTGASTITDWDDYREFIASGTGTSGLDQEAVQDVVGALVVGGTGISATYDDASSPATLTIASTAGSGLTQENVEDIVGALVVAGANTTVTYDDSSSPATLTIASSGGGSGGGLTQENVEDIVGTLLVAGSNMTVTYDDASSPATITLASTGGSSGGTGDEALAEGRIELAVLSNPTASTLSGQGTTFVTVSGGAAGTLSHATPLQATPRIVFSTGTVSTTVGVSNANFSRSYSSTANATNWTSRFFWGTDATHDNSCGVAVGYTDLNVHSTIPSTAYTNMVIMGADGGASPDTNWQIMTRAAAGGATKTSTGIARGTNQYFRLTIKCVSGTGFTITVEQYSVFNTGWAVVYGPTLHTTTLPASSTSLNMGEVCRMRTHTTTGTTSIAFVHFVGTYQFPT